MKSRSHRLPTISDTPDDWVDESWTVDCVCGVNFDDGEEMVDCDECGVWVHTRCSRYVKSEKLFSCDKCKSKKLRKETEESEVAQLLVELPTKTLRMDNPYPMNCPPLQIWTEIPLEEKVHVQGIPGGDPSLFTGVSSVFGQQVVDSSPRMRHAGSLPQLTSNTSTSTLMKRTSSSGGKDSNNNNSYSNNNGSRKRNKDLSSNGREVEKKVVPTSRRHEGVKNGSANKSVTGGVTTVSSGPSSDNEGQEHNLLSPRNGSDDEVPTHRTLPGLIAEIMSKGKRMTYEELCNAVLPHWPNLRKHNGERYAYSSHSQAVLDCLRNRSEWSRLVDRGPKTNAGRKRRKTEADAQNVESEEEQEQDNDDDDDYSTDKNTKDVDNTKSNGGGEEFPKRKRKKTRKHRRLAMQGTRMKRRRKAEVVSDDVDSSESSESSEGSVFSDEGGRTSVANEVSASASSES